MSDRPLEGIRVVDIGISTAGPYAARLLGDLGADVVKVEPLDGENTRALGLRYGDTGYLYHVNNYNKRSLTLKVQHPEGREIFLALVAKSDVLIENFAIGTMDAWGVGYDACRAVNPSIIYCSAKGFGESGPLKDQRAFDTVTQALSGLMHLTGQPGTPPVKGGPSVCDLLGAAVSSMAVMSAIVGRQPGVSQFIDTSLFDMGAWSLAWLWPYLQEPPAPPLASIGNAHPGAVPFGDYACADGSVMVTVTTDGEWRALAPLLALPAGWDVVARRAQQDRIGAALAAWLRDRPADAAAHELQALGVPAAPVLDLAQVAASGQLASRRMVVDVDHPAYGRVPLIQSPLAQGDLATRTPWRLQPTLGQDTADVVGELLGRADDLARLRAAGVVG